MALFAYTVMRNMPATNAQGKDCLIAIALVRHENGYTDRVAINEDFLRFQSGGDPLREEQIIEHEIGQALNR